jgi:iron-sulfur cluster assembly protein
MVPLAGGAPALAIRALSRHIPSMITVSPAAVDELRALLEKRGGEPGMGLRLLVQKGGCAGFQYALKIDHTKSGDTVVSEGGVSVLVDPESLPYLDGAMVDYHHGLTDAGFKLVNPNAARSCGCGSSFEPAKKPEAPPPPADPTASAIPCPGGEGE